MGTGATLGFSLPLHLKHRPRRAFLRGRPPHSPPGPRLPSAAPTSTNRSHRDARCQRRLLPPPPQKKKHYPVGSPTQAFTGGWHQPSPLLGPEYGTSPTVTAAGGVEIPPTHTHRVAEHLPEALLRTHGRNHPWKQPPLTAASGLRCPVGREPKQPRHRRELS